MFSIIIFITLWSVRVIIFFFHILLRYSYSYYLMIFFLFVLFHHDEANLNRIIILLLCFNILVSFHVTCLRFFVNIGFLTARVRIYGFGLWLVFIGGGFVFFVIGLVCSQVLKCTFWGFIGFIGDMILNDVINVFVIMTIGLLKNVEISIFKFIVQDSFFNLILILFFFKILFIFIRPYLSKLILISSICLSLLSFLPSLILILISWYLTYLCLPPLIFPYLLLFSLNFKPNPYIPSKCKSIYP